MRKNKLNNNSEYSFALVSGIIVSTGLFMMINLMSSTRSENKLPVIIDLLVWEEERRDIKQLEIKQEAPPKEMVRLKKIKQKKIIKELPVKPPVTKMSDLIAKKIIPELNKIVKKKAQVTPQVSETMIDSLPKPVPLFKLTELPRFLHREEPDYPEVMRSIGKTSVVVLDVLIDKKGKVRKVTVLKSGGEHFDSAAMKGMRASSFIPAKLNGKSVAVILRFPVKFRLL